MSVKGRLKGHFGALLQQRADSAEGTSRKLHEALDRFEQGKSKAVPAGSKLTIRNLAAEAGVSKDTPLSRYPKGRPGGGSYRFPSVVERFNELKLKLTPRQAVEGEEGELKRLRGRIKELERALLMSARANNLLDAETLTLKGRNIELEEDNARLRAENARLRQGSLRVLPTSK